MFEPAALPAQLLALLAPSGVREVVGAILGREQRAAMAAEQNAERPPRIASVASSVRANGPSGRNGNSHRLGKAASLRQVVEPGGRAPRRRRRGR